MSPGWNKICKCMRLKPQPRGCSVELARVESHSGPPKAHGLSSWVCCQGGSSAQFRGQAGRQGRLDVAQTQQGLTRGLQPFILLLFSFS